MRNTEMEGRLKAATIIPKKIEKKPMEPGFYPRLSNDDYHADRSHDSSSTLKQMLRHPKDYYEQRVLGQEKDGPSGPHLDLGSYVHSLILEPHLTDSEFGIYSGTTKRGKEWEAFKVDNPGKILLKNSQAVQAKAMIQKLQENKYALEILKSENGVSEHSLFTTIEGIPIKVRADFYADYMEGGVIVDVKTTNEAVSFRAMQDTVDNWDYDLSAALYVDAYTEHQGIPHRFFWLFLSKISPYKTKIVELTPDMYENGKRKYRDAMKMLKKARETGQYYEDGILGLDLRREYRYESRFDEATKDAGEDVTINADVCVQAGSNKEA